MQLTDDDIARIAQWDPIAPGFGREDHRTRLRIQAIVDNLNASKTVGCELLEDDGMSNYFVLFTYLAADVRNVPFPGADGILIYLSACAPVGAAGRSRKCVGPGFITHEHLDPSRLLDALQPLGALEEKTIGAVQANGYTLLSAAEAATPLPHPIDVIGYQLIRQETERLFDALFLNDD